MKKKLPINKDRLLEEIRKCESNHTFTGIMGLCECLASQPWAKANKITPSVVRLRLIEFNLYDKIKTKKGKRGFKKTVVANKIVDGLNKFAGQLEKDETFPATTTIISKTAVVSRLKKHVPSRYTKLAQKCSTSRIAAVKLHCLDCVGYESVEVKKCTGYECALWLYRPFK